MSVYSSKCAYQFREPAGASSRDQPETKWGKVPIYGPKQSYKYLGYFVNISLDFATQHKEMIKRLNKACANLFSELRLNIQEAVTYVNSDLASVLRYRMYLVAFPDSFLETFDARLASAVKRLSQLAKSTPTDMLIDQGLYNVYQMQGTIRTEFLISALESGDSQCRLSSRIMHSRLTLKLASKGFDGISPLSKAGLQIRS